MTPDELFDRVADKLTPLEVSTGKLFGKRALKVHGKAFACLKGDYLAFKLGEGTPAHTKALALPGSELFDASGKNQPFKDWVAVPQTHADQWLRLSKTALKTLTP
ncbi:TfoX/Sxy family protein (plasmid) [Streptomyces sp. NBC_01450]|uniref:hypothetical protein n=1 Tax=Streptomyces sp. NBC_01450 TaxID=2903871 RepID=UPI002E374617|nr:hypothetical protein [Streptomyces sp. NBC_01450]